MEAHTETGKKMCAENYCELVQFHTQTLHGETVKREAQVYNKEIVCFLRFVLGWFGGSV